MALASGAISEAEVIILVGSNNDSFDVIIYGADLRRRALRLMYAAVFMSSELPVSSCMSL